MKKYKFSYDMYILDADGSYSKKVNDMSPVGVGYIETDDKNITTKDIYEYIMEQRKHYSPTYNELVNHPKDPYGFADLRYVKGIFMKVLKIESDLYLVVNNIRKI